MVAVDVGNTRIRLARVSDGQVQAFARLPTDPAGISWALPHLLSALGAGETVNLIGLSCVVPALASRIREDLARWGQVREVSPQSVEDMPIGYRDPDQLGPDRIANAIAARTLVGSPCLIVDLGTALTIDVVDPAGGIKGGLIFPGLEAARGALLRSTARIEPEARGAPALIGRSTAEGVAGGLYYGYPALIEGLVARLREELGGGAPVVLTGGGATSLPGLLEGNAWFDPFLTLKGIAEHARKGA